MAKLHMLMSRPHYTIFFKEKVYLHPQLRLIPKAVSSFNINQPIYSPVFFPKPHLTWEEEHLHTLDVIRALVFYLDRSNSISPLNSLWQLQIE